MMTMSIDKLRDTAKTMKTKQKIVKAKVDFGGIYEWGGGFMTLDAAEKWNEFWRNWRGSFWKTVENDVGSTYVVSTGGGGMIHPMGFEIVYRRIGSSFRNEQEFFPELEELEKACREVADACGGTAQFETTEHEI